MAETGQTGRDRTNERDEPGRFSKSGAFRIFEPVAGRELNQPRYDAKVEVRCAVPLKTVCWLDSIELFVLIAYH